MILNAFRTNSRNIIGRNPSMVIPLLANQDLTLMLPGLGPTNNRGLINCTDEGILNAIFTK